MDTRNLNFTISTNIAPIEVRKQIIGEECLLSTSTRPYLPKDVVVVEKSRKPFVV